MSAVVWDNIGLGNKSQTTIFIFFFGRRCFFPLLLSIISSAFLMLTAQRSNNTHSILIKAALPTPPRYYDVQITAAAVRYIPISCRLSLLDEFPVNSALGVWANLTFASASLSPFVSLVSSFLFSLSSVFVFLVYLLWPWCRVFSAAESNRNTNPHFIVLLLLLLLFVLILLSFIKSFLFLCKIANTGH